MSFLPKVNLRRSLLIARRDYLGYIKTWGFWISFFLPFIFGAMGFFLSAMDFDFSPPKYETILDETGVYEQGIKDRLATNHARLERAALEALAEPPLMTELQGTALLAKYDAGGIEAAKQYVNAEVPIISGQIDNIFENIDPGLIFVDAPAETLEGLMPYLKDETKITVNGETASLNGALVITGTEAEPKIEYWSQRFTNPKLKTLSENFFKARAEAAYLESGGLSKDGLDAAREGEQSIAVFDPTKLAGESGGGQEVSLTDKVPYIVAAVLAGLLWLTVFSGAYMLLTSMLEEKLNKLMEMMLASTRFSEIILGKLLGVAALTITAMAPYILIGIGGVLAFIFMDIDPEIAAGLKQSFPPKMIIFFVIFLVLGYIFYGACFIALGSLSQSMQDAQTLTTPITIILTLCIMVVPLGIENPDSPIIKIASLFPLSAPFASIIRLPSDPPLWELIFSASMLALLCVGVIALAGRIFRFGVLSGAGVSAVSAWFKRVVLRQKAS